MPATRGLIYQFNHTNLSAQTREDATLPLGSPGIQLSLYTPIDFSSPTLHLAPIIITLPAFKILFQVKEPEVCFASKIVPVGKYLDLNTR